jgi:hypothetical protein
MAGESMSLAQEEALRSIREISWRARLPYLVFFFDVVRRLTYTTLPTLAGE